MSSTFRIDGLAELRDELRRLPEALRDEARDIILREATDAKNDIVAGYPARTGDLKNHVTIVQTPGGRFGAGATVRNTAKHAWLFENGTQARQTALGANRGAMAPGHAFVPPMRRHRRAMYGQLADLLRTKGLQVSGS
jgi:hypothetical protein